MDVTNVTKNILKICFAYSWKGAHISDKTSMKDRK